MKLFRFFLQFESRRPIFGSHIAAILLRQRFFSLSLGFPRERRYTPEKPQRCENITREWWHLMHRLGMARDQILTNTIGRALEETSRIRQVSPVWTARWIPLRLQLHVETRSGGLVL